MRPSITFVAGVAAGIAFVFACGHMSVGRDASAAPADCAAWQFARTAFFDSPAGSAGTVQTSSGSNGMTSIENVPAGWEPFASIGDQILIRRCTP